MSVDDLKQISLGRTLRERGVAQWLKAWHCLAIVGLETCTLLAWLSELCVSLCLCLCLQSGFLWKIPTCFTELRETMFFCSVLSLGRTSLSGVEERMEWDGGSMGRMMNIKVREAWEGASRAHMHSWVLCSSCVWWQRGEGNERQMAFYLCQTIVLPWLWL